MAKHLSQKKKLEILPFLIERDGGFHCFYCEKPLSIETLVYEHLNSKPQDNRFENLVLSCQSCNVKKGNDFDLMILGEEKLRENELKHFVQKNKFQELQNKQEASTEISINQSNFEITEQHLRERLAVEDSLEYTMTINNCACICRKKTGHGSQQSVRNYIDILTCEEGPFMISRNDERKKIIVKRRGN